jgi:Acetyltransferase (GNAT) domain
MSYELRIVNPLDIPDWDELILAFPECSVFHSSGWVRVLSKAYDYQPIYFGLFDGDRLLALLPIMEVNSFLTGKRGVSLPFADRCEPLISDPDQFDALLAYVKEYGKKTRWKYLELRGGTTFLPGAEPSASYFGHTLDLRIGEGHLFSGLRDSTRRNIKKAVKEGVEIVISDTLEAVSSFYALNRTTRKHHGLPPQPFSFFRAIHEYLLSKEQGFVVVASYQGKSVAAAIFFHLGRKALYKYGASSLENQSVRANNLVMWKAIEHLSKDGFESLSFGRTDMDHDGLRQFKNGWGPEEYSINYFRHDLRQNKFVEEQRRVHSCSKAIFGRLPIPVLNLIGSLAYRHMG